MVMVLCTTQKPSSNPSSGMPPMKAKNEWEPSFQVFWTVRRRNLDPILPPKYPLCSLLPIVNSSSQWLGVFKTIYSLSKDLHKIRSGWSPIAVGRRLLHVIINTINKPEFYSSTMSFVGKRACSSWIAKFFHRTQGIVGILADNANLMVSVMSLDKLFRFL